MHLALRLRSNWRKGLRCPLGVASTEGASFRGEGKPEWRVCGVDVKRVLSVLATWVPPERWSVVDFHRDTIRIYLKSASQNVPSAARCQRATVNTLYSSRPVPETTSYQLRSRHLPQIRLSTRSPTVCDSVKRSMYPTRRKKNRWYRDYSGASVELVACSRPR